jgi:hypothetical protein
MIWAIALAGSAAILLAMWFDKKESTLKKIQKEKKAKENETSKLGTNAIKNPDGPPPTTPFR